jgi:predicted DNA-binding transcriptional regulator AlpA
MAAARHSALPLPPRRGLSREEAAAYVSVSPNFFDSMIRDGLMPGPKRVKTRVFWDRHQLDAAFDSLPGDTPPTHDEGSDDNDWD